jgi:hypothetical protein
MIMGAISRPFEFLRTPLFFSVFAPLREAIAFSKVFAENGHGFRYG